MLILPHQPSEPDPPGEGEAERELDPLASWEMREEVREANLRWLLVSAYIVGIIAWVRWILT